VRVLVDEIRTPQPGGVAVAWDGKNELGDPVSSGVYYYRLSAKSFSQTKKMVFLK
jgi:flagellar hook assembly protein FlgD